MEIYAETAMSILDELHTERLAYHSEYLPLAYAINRLESYEDTGLSPEEIERILDSYGRGMTLRTENAQRLEIIKEIPINRLCALPGFVDSKNDAYTGPRAPSARRISPTQPEESPTSTK